MQLFKLLISFVHASCNSDVIQKHFNASKQKAKPWIKIAIYKQCMQYSFDSLTVYIPFIVQTNQLCLWRKNIYYEMNVISLSIFCLPCLTNLHAAYSSSLTHLNQLAQKFSGLVYVRCLHSLKNMKHLCSLFLNYK